MFKLLIDTHHHHAAARVLPQSWLDGFSTSVYEPRRPTDRVEGDFDLSEAEVLVVRSVTRVDADVLKRAPRLRAVVTCSSGFDHLDVDALRARGVAWFHGRGGNAVAVTEWVLWALHRQWGLAYQPSRSLVGRRVIVVGCGAVGACVMAALRGLGAEVVAVDPPRGRRDPNFEGVSLEEALAGGCDALTLHVPRVYAGPDATHHLIGPSQLEALRGAAVLNAARGGVLDETAAVAERRAGRISGLWLDTFEREPEIAAETLALCDGATPHIAGHSVEGKLKVAWAPMSAVRAHLQLPEIASVDLPEIVCPDAFVALDQSSRALRDGTEFVSLRAQHRRREGQYGGAGTFADALAEVGCSQFSPLL